ncbi:hypothetical protein BsWGS_23200 [Bradybaena similaris]
MEELSNTEEHFDDFLSITRNGRSEAEESYFGDYDLGEQYQYNHYDFIYNLSSIDSNLFKIYEFDAGNSSEIHDVLSRSRTVVLSIFAVIFLVGLIGNALVIYTVSRYVTMRRVTYLYLLNLSMADILYLLVCLPTLSVSYVLVDWRFGRVFCKLQNYVMSVSMSVSVLSIVATGLDRYLAVIYPLGARTYRTVKRAVSVISLTWTFSLAVMAPRIALFDEISVWHVTGMTTLCSRVHTGTVLQIDSSLNFVFMYFLPLLVLCVCHSRIGQRLWTGKRPGNPLARTGQMRMLLVRHKRRIAKMIFAVTIIFAVGWLPIHVYHLVEDFDKGNILLGNIVDRGTIALFFSFGANALNPIIYCLFSSHFRKHFIKALRCWKSRAGTSINGHDLGYLRNPVTLETQLENSRPLPVLLPRPASLLADSASCLDTDPIYIGRLTQLASGNILSLQPLLQETPEVSSSCSEPSPACSPLSVATVAHVEVNAPQLTSGSVCPGEQDRSPLLSSPSQGTVHVNNVFPRCSYANLQRSRSVSSVATRAYSFSNTQRPRSMDSYRCDKEMPGMSNRLGENVSGQHSSDGSTLNRSFDKRYSSKTTALHYGDDKVSTYERNQKQPFTTEKQKTSVCCNISSLSESSTKSALISKNTLRQAIEYPNKMASTTNTKDHIEREASSLDNDQNSDKRATPGASISRLPRAQTISSLHEPATSRLSAEIYTNTKLLASSSRSCSSSLHKTCKHHSSVQGSVSKDINYVGCKYKDKASQKGNDQCLPPAD